ncbi:Retrovirus-related Pol polyprotein from transposon TNT 1-94 [Melia azedarach]|uniref:Retrovirus-related Pol polyprotein from transposon TNT 1-94 n=1 Tax=Melia azedarach TaxID=155640 RepID=A0ACC1YS22_MELAZ|nr:Retrovirus-related Pol polyprotein from transposon TNT 1-94 [Melia azedarach]
MEPDDLSFIEISGEDDSLLPLQHIPTDDVSSLNKIYFTCSPLQIPRSACSVNPPPLLSPIEGIKGTEDARKLDISSNRESAGKENVNSNKSEAPKLSMEPQQMKRKKKGGGYNLRKSLAWDKAFFTDEGVLDPSELSLISGNFGKSSGKMLSVIEEDGIESSGCNSEDLTALEENLFKDLPASNASEDRKSSGALFSKIGSSAGVSVASTSSAKRKVLSAHDVSRNKRSGPRPVASASCVSNVKRNQKAQPAVHIQRNVGLKASSNSIKGAQTDARSGLPGRSMAVKSSVQQARRNVANSALEVKSSARSQHPLVSKTNNTSQIDDRGPPLPTPGHVSNNYDGDSRKAAFSLPSGGSKQYTQLQTAKPSGLRMPSPSLGFFNQSKASASHSLSLRSNQACNVPESNISSSRKFGALNATHERAIPVPPKMPDMVNGVTASDTRIPSSIKGSSIPTSLNTNSHDKMQSDLCIKEVEKVELNVSSKSNSLGILNNQKKLHSSCSDIDQQSLQNAGPSRNEKIHMVDNESKSTDDKLPLYRAPSDQLKNDDNEGIAKIYPMSVDSSGTELENPLFVSHLQSTDITDNQCVEDKACNSLIRNHAASSESQSGDANSDSIKGTVKKQDDWLGSEHNINEQHKTQAEETMPCTTQVSIQGQKAWINSVALPKENRSSELENCKTAKLVDASPEDKFFNGGVVESSHGRLETEYAKEGKRYVTGVNFCTKSQVRDAEEQSVDGILSAGRVETVLCSSALDKMVVDNVSESLIAANGSDLKILAAICSMPLPVQDCGFNMAEIAERSHEDNSISGFTDAQFNHDIELHSQTTSEESEMISKDKKINMVTTVIAKVSCDCSNSRGSGGCELDLQHFETQPCVLEQTKNSVEVNDMIAAMQAKNHYVIDDVNEHKVIENTQYGLLMNKQYSNADLKSAYDISYCQQSTSKVHNDWMSNINTHIVCEQTVEGNQILQASDECLSEDSMPLEDSRESNTGKVADVCLDVKSYCRRGLESSQDLLEHEHVEERNEGVAGLDKTIEKSVVEDAPMQILESSLLVDSYNSNFKATVDDTCEQSPVRSLLDSDLEAAQSSLDARGLCLSDKLIVNNYSLEEYWDKNLCGNLVDAVLGKSDGCGNESRSSVFCTQVAVPVMEGGIDEEQKADCPSEDDDVQNIQVNELKNDILSEEASISLNNGSSNHQIKNELENPIFTTIDATMSSSGGVFQNIEVNVIKSDISTVDAETSISQRNGGSNCEMQLELEDAVLPTEDSNVIDFSNSRNDKKQGNIVTKPPPHAVPFSDEWLAAFEAAGEEILTMKSGAVQNSPPDKSLPEPGPWSPVKRKNNQGIGPFDCTKFTNGNSNIPPS